MMLDKLKAARRDAKWLALVGGWLGFLVVAMFLFTQEGGDSFVAIVKHRLERNLLHFAAAPLAYTGLMWGVWILDRKVDAIELKGWWVFWTPGIVGGLVIAALEWCGPGWIGPNGGPDRFKSVIDVAVWTGCFGLTGWTLYRLAELLAVAVGQIQKGRLERAKAKR